MAHGSIGCLAIGLCLIAASSASILWLWSTSLHDSAEGIEVLVDPVLRDGHAFWLPRLSDAQPPIELQETSLLGPVDRVDTAELIDLLSHPFLRLNQLCRQSNLGLFQSGDSLST